LLVAFALETSGASAEFHNICFAAVPTLKGQANGSAKNFARR
jgi:hypothetical protein